MVGESSDHKVARVDRPATDYILVVRPWEAVLNHASQVDLTTTCTPLPSNKIFDKQISSH